MIKTRLLSAVAALAILAALGGVLAQTQPDPHHPEQAAGTPQPAPSASEGMMGMMSEMMKMMSDHQMSMGCMMMGPAMADRTEGKIAFLRAELKISGEQSKLWEVFADALRKSRSVKGDGQGTMTGMGGTGPLDRLSAEEQNLTERLDSVRAQRQALEPLYRSLSDEQRRSADELLSCPGGMMGGGMMGGGMMGGGMMSGGMGQGQMPDGNAGTMPMENKSE